MRNSIAITTYNGEKYIEEQLDSIRNQTLPPDEVIIRDDGSKDNTPYVIREYIARYHLDWDFEVNDINKGFFDNFFDTIKKCSGDVIYLADQDDVWDLKKLEMFSSLYNKCPQIMMIQSSFRFIDSKGFEIENKELYHGKKVSDQPIELSLLDMLRFAGSGYTMSFRRIVSDKIFSMGLEKKKDIFAFHDILLGQVAAIMGGCFLISDIIDSHRLHSNNETQKMGVSYISGRTKNVQLQILERKFGQSCELSVLVNDAIKEKTIQMFGDVAENRIKLIRDKKFLKLPYLIKHRNYYTSKKGIITDIMYALGLERLLLYIFNRL